MNLIRYKNNPWSFLDKTFEDFGDEFFGLNPFKSSEPACNIKETEKEYQIDMSIPGFSKNDVNINIENDVLTVNGLVEDIKETEEENWHRKEFRAQSFTKQWRLPEDVTNDEISAKFENGILKLSLGKKEPVIPEKNIKQIEIQ
jgi:HSP20 family protein